MKKKNKTSPLVFGWPQNKVAHFYQWLKKSPVSFDLIDTTTDDDIMTINFHGKDIFKKTINNWNKENK